MKLKFLGASGTVTGSSYAITSASGQSLLVDLGMFQGIDAIDKLNYDPYDFDPKNLVGAVLTHAHLDHCGRLPILYSHGFTGNIWMTPATADLTELSLIDSAKIAKMDNKPILYDKLLAETCISNFKTVNYNSPTQIGDFLVTFRDAGHILGSASLEIEIDNQKLVFSGDLGNSPEDLLRDTELIDSGDIVIMESTYGESLHPKQISSDIIQNEINLVEASGGTLLIPAFSLDRTQEILHIIMHLKQQNKIKNQTPIFMDSPMALKATAIYMKYPRIFNSHLQTDFKVGSPFDFPGLEVAYKREESEAIHIVDHAAHYLPQTQTRLLIVGYQGEETLGRALKEGIRQVDIDGISISINATINSTSAMSSHADQAQLIRWLKHIKNVKQVFITHGEDSSRKILSEKISSNLKIVNISLPFLNQEIVLS
jgi:metallo-beta-lactamase family protein